jgi:hypothetical protein
LSDASSTGMAMTAFYGTPTWETFAPFYTPSGSVLFAGSTLKSTAAASLPALGTGDFTVELWAYLTAAPATVWTSILSINGGGINDEIRIAQAFGSTTSVGVCLPCASTGTLGTCPCGTTTPGTVTACAANQNHQGYLLPSSAMPLNTWLHIALTRRGATHVLYVNGAVAMTVTTSVVYAIPAGPLYLGGTVYSNVGDGGLSGYVSNVRVTTTAVYSGAFTPPTAPFSPAGSAAATNVAAVTPSQTVFLLQTQSAATYLNDASSTGVTMASFAGSPTWNAFSPF